MPGKASRDKGRRGERKAAKALTSMGLPAQRAAYAGHCCPDLEHGVEGVHIEVKYQSRPNIQAAYRQAVADASRQGCAAVCMTKMVTKQGGEPWLVTFDLVQLWTIIDAFERARP